MHIFGPWGKPLDEWHSKLFIVQPPRPLFATVYLQVAAAKAGKKVTCDGNSQGTAAGIREEVAVGVMDKRRRDFPRKNEPALQLDTCACVGKCFWLRDTHDSAGQSAAVIHKARTNRTGFGK